MRSGAARAAAAAPLPGDPLFFGASPQDVTHVGISVGDGLMVDAPHSGTVVRVEATPMVPGQRRGTDRYVGATRPGS